MFVVIQVLITEIKGKKEKDAGSLNPKKNQICCKDVQLLDRFGQPFPKLGNGFWRLLSYQVASINKTRTTNFQFPTQECSNINPFYFKYSKDAQKPTKETLKFSPNKGKHQKACNSPPTSLQKPSQATKSDLKNPAKLPSKTTRNIQRPSKSNPQRHPERFAKALPFRQDGVATWEKVDEER